MNKTIKLHIKDLFFNIFFAIIFTGALSAAAFNSMETFIKYQVSNSLYSVAVSLHSLYSEYDIYDHDHLNHLEILMNGYKENLDIDTAIYLNGKELISTTNIKNDVDENLKNNVLIKELKTKGISINGDADVNGNGYYNCTVALYDEDGNYIGAIFVGKEVDLIKTALRGRQMIYITYMWVVCIAYVLGIGIFGAKSYAKYIDLESGANEKNNTGD